MTCKACGVGRREALRIDALIDRGDRLLVVRGIPADVCAYCGDRRFSRATQARLETIALADLPAVPVVRARCLQFDAGKEG